MVHFLADWLAVKRTTVKKNQFLLVPASNSFEGEVIGLMRKMDVTL